MGVVIVIIFNMRSLLFFLVSSIIWVVKYLKILVGLKDLIKIIMLKNNVKVV